MHNPRDRQRALAQFRQDACIIWWRIRALEFQQENQDWKEKSATFIKGSQLVLYQILHYSICASEGNSKYKISVTTQISNSNVVI